MSFDDVDSDKPKGFFTQVLDTFRTVPCTRTAYLHAFSTGLVAGVTTFLFTSRARRATHIGVLSFVFVMPGSLYQNSKRELQKERSRKPTYIPWQPDEAREDSIHGDEDSIHGDENSKS